jgi:hypothetical protein
LNVVEKWIHANVYVHDCVRAMGQVLPHPTIAGTRQL